MNGCVANLAMGEFQKRQGHVLIRSNTSADNVSQMLTRRHTDFGDGPVPDDYQIREDGRVVGRIYRAVNVTKDPWVWSITARQPQTGSDKGKAETLDDALKAFRAAWERK